jgi:hypothetical protein
MPRGAFVVNRFHLPPSGPAVAATASDTKKAIADLHVALDEDAPDRVARAHADHFRLAALDASWVRVLKEPAETGVPIVRVPELSSDVHDVVLLAKLADTLMSGGV